MPQPFYPWKTASVPTDYRARWLSESVWTVLENRKSLAVYFPLGNFPASGFYMPTFQNTLSVPSSWAGRYQEWLGLRNVGALIWEKVWLKNSLSQ